MKNAKNRKVAPKKAAKKNGKDAPTRFEKVRKGKMRASLERWDEIFSKYSSQVEKLYKRM